MPGPDKPPPIESLPPQLALALALPGSARLQVKIGQRVVAGALLAAGDDDSVDVIAPQSGTVAGVAPRALAGGGQSLCLLLESGHADPAAAAATIASPEGGQALPLLLKRAGIVGLGGGARPAWHKWRRQLRFFVVNGLETEPLAHHDAAEIQAAKATVLPRIKQVARAFAAPPLLALPQQQHEELQDPIIRRLPADYALGNERLLIRALCGLSVPAQAIPADYGVACFNVATVLAMAQAIRRGTALHQRTVTVHEESGKIRVLRVPFGATIAQLRAFINAAATAPAFVGGDDECRAAADAAVINAAVTVIRFGLPQPGKTMPCISCGACDAACPVDLSPQQLYRLGQDAQSGEMRQQGLMRCLLCRRCDAVCPSSIPLTAFFAAEKKQHSADYMQQQEVERRQQRFEHHQQRQLKKEKRVSWATLHDKIKQATRRAGAKKRAP